MGGGFVVDQLKNEIHPSSATEVTLTVPGAWGQVVLSNIPLNQK